MSDAALFIEWVYANPGLPPEEYAVKCQEFIDEATAAERKACAKIAAEFPAHIHGSLCSKPHDTAAQVAREIAKAILARKTA